MYWDGENEWLEAEVLKTANATHEVRYLKDDTEQKEDLAPAGDGTAWRLKGCAACGAVVTGRPPHDAAKARLCVSCRTAPAPAPLQGDALVGKTVQVKRDGGVELSLIHI